MSDWPAEYDKVFSRVQKLRRSSPGEWICLCPAHDDHNPSLLLKPAGGRLLVWCGAGCKFPAIRDALKLTDKDFFMPEDKTPRKFVKAYQYLDANRKLLYEVVRWEPKSFSQRRLNPAFDKTKPATDDNQPFIWNLEGVQRVLYRLPDLMDALEKGPDRWVFVCYSPDTEILSGRGWIKFPELTDEDIVAQYDADDASISFVNPSARQVLDYDGDMIRISNDWCDLLVTPDHRLLRWRPRTKPRVIRAADYEQTMYLPVSGHYYPSVDETITDAQARLVVAFQADGILRTRCNDKLCWNLKKDRKKDRLRRLLADNGIAWTESVYASTPQHTVFWVQKDAIDAIVGRWLDGKKFKWAMMSWPHDVRESAIRELAFWDGDGRDSGTFVRFFTAEKQSADVISAVSSITGCGVTQRLDDRKGGTNYVVNIKLSKEWRVSSTDPSVVSYSGKVYCCTVPSGFVVVRRNGKVTIAGNCEGEKSVDRLWELGFLATTNSGGAGKWIEQYSDNLKGLKVALIPDEDAPGLAHGRQIVKSLLGKAKKLVVARLKDLPGSPKDVDDYLDQKAPGEATSSADELKARMRDLVTANADKDPEKALGDQATPMSIMFLMSRVGLGLKVEKHELEAAIDYLKTLG